jgi:hypothetical protein
MNEEYCPDCEASFQFYKDSMSKLENLSRQNEGWLKSQRKSK